MLQCIFPKTRHILLASHGTIIKVSINLTDAALTESLYSSFTYWPNDVLYGIFSFSTDAVRI